MIKIKRGLDLPITGEPDQSGIQQERSARTVATIGFDYVGMKPTMEVQEGDEVKLGQVIFRDKKNPGVNYTALAGGRVAAINRGEKRALQSVVIEVAEQEEAVEFPSFSRDQFSKLEREKVQQVLIDSGMWTGIRTRPFSKVPAPGSAPRSIFVAAMDTNPLAPNPAVIINEEKESFCDGLQILSRLTDGKVYLCKAPNADIPAPGGGQVQVETFDGPHPAGLPGTHIHFLDPVSAQRMAWVVGYQDVIAIAKLFSTGRLWTQRVIALAGPQLERPRLVRTRLGACTDDLVAGEVKLGDNRVISGSVLGGRKAAGAYAYLGRHHNQVTVLREGRERGIFEYLWLGKDKFSVLNIFTSKLNPGKKFNFTTTTNGSERAMVPVGAYEEVMPLDILPTQLLRAIIVGDTETAQLLGALELDEEDLALCTFVCPGKYEYGPLLRDNLTRIEQEG